VAKTTVSFKIDDLDFSNEQSMVKLKNSLQDHCNGYCILFDIIDSTKRKKSNHNWHYQTEALYDSFFELVKKLKDILNEYENSPVIKLLGDGMFVFFETSKSGCTEDDKKPPEKVTSEIFSRLISYLKFIEERSSSFNNLRLKTVFTYVTGIRNVIKNKLKSCDDGLDVLGRGIDFTFRLEKFADYGYIVTNKMLAEALINDAKQTKGDTCLNDYNIVPCSKRIKGWDVENFFSLINNGNLRSAYEHKLPSPDTDHVYLELLQYIISHGDKTAKLDTDELNWRVNNG